MPQLRVYSIGAVAKDYQSKTIDNLTAEGISTSILTSGSRGAFVTLEGGDARWRNDGTDPTSLEGHYLANGAQLEFMNYRAASQFKVIAIAGNITIRVSVY